MPGFPKLPFPPKFLLVFPALLLLLIGAWSSFYTIQAEEEGVVLRFGKYSDTVNSGLHFKIPFGVDQVIPVAVRRQQKLEFGFGTDGATSRWQVSDRSEWQLAREMVTGDLNSALVEWVVQYRVDDPKDYLFNVRDPDGTLRDVAESVMREAVGDRTVDEVLTIGRQDIEAESLQKLKDLTTKYGMGLTIDQVQLKDVNPPRPVQSSFNEVNEAQQQKEEAINIANGLYNRAVPKARGEAERAISDAQGYATQRINEAEGDAARFNALYSEYAKAADITKRRLYLETMSDVVPRLGRKIIIDEEAKQILPLLNLNDTSNLPIK
ncbi:FtsH protease activity modulator HflK [Haloferula sp.]|uniref:FtsH protease activity modulator HflK n=1 Tax=Haloferula sp. TaxID=2497595 RepID=UPI003C70B8A8